MATFVIVNETDDILPLADFGVVLQANGTAKSQNGIGDTLTTDQPYNIVPRLLTTSALLAAGSISFTVTPTAAETSAGLTSPPSNSVDAAQLKTNSVTSAKIAALAVTTAKVAAGAITGAKLDPAPFRHFVTLGRNGAGAVTATGAAVGDKVVAITDLTTAVAGEAIFESTITVVNQIQQSSALDKSAVKYNILLLKQS